MPIELFTVGREFFPHYRMLLWHNPRETFAPEFNTGDRFRLVFIEGGTGILRLGERREPFIATSLFCLNETDQPSLEQSVDVQARAFYFHPNVINGAFTFEMVHNPTEELSVTDSQDLYWLEPFAQRSPKYNGHLRVGPASAQRVSRLFDAVNEGITQQRDNGWPCRSRAFFLELLFLVRRIFSAPQTVEEIVLSESEGDVESVILYLHTHYQEKITLPKLAKRFHTNRTTLTQRFRETTGMPVMTYLTQLRVRLAALMLRDTELSITEILARVGFKDNTHFWRTFRKHTGCSPSEYRQRYCWMLH